MMYLDFWFGMAAYVIIWIVGAMMWRFSADVAGIAGTTVRAVVGNTIYVGQTRGVEGTAKTWIGWLFGAAVGVVGSAFLVGASLGLLYAGLVFVLAGNNPLPPLWLPVPS